MFIFTLPVSVIETKMQVKNYPVNKKYILLPKGRHRTIQALIKTPKFKMLMTLRMGADFARGRILFDVLQNNYIKIS